MSSVKNEKQNVYNNWANLLNISCMFLQKINEYVPDESCCFQRAFINYFDLIVVNESHDQTFAEVLQAWNALQVMDQWVPSTWVYS